MPQIMCSCVSTRAIGSRSVSSICLLIFLTLTGPPFSTAKSATTSQSPSESRSSHAKIPDSSIPNDSYLSPNLFDHTQCRLEQSPAKRSSHHCPPVHHPAWNNSARSHNPYIMAHLYRVASLLPTHLQQAALVPILPL